ncbi:MAG: Na(+)-translocating NADH-quinone reductase subunit A [Thermoguttaceae bacterium]|nr:Na(+)-translocating NADH-quinone reductase subunit A [Thermoguttaceae bacterium]
MKNLEITKGLDLALAGAPQQRIDPNNKPIKHVAVTGPDYVAMRPSVAVEEGQRVLAGEVLFEDKKNPGVKFTSPGAGVVEKICRGEKRAFRSIVIALDEGDAANQSVEFEKFDTAALDSLPEEKVRDILASSGLWTALRTRPFSVVPKLGTAPHSLFVTVIDTNPGAPDPALIIAERISDFTAGLKVLSRICGQKIWLCKAPNVELPEETVDKVEIVNVTGPHPAGLAGTHIHFLDPVGLNKTVWTIGYQDVIAIGALFTTGRYPAERVVALSGPMVKNPRLLRTRVGACLKELTEGELKEGEVRIISGSVLCGRAAEENGLCALGPYVNQVSVIGDGNPRELFAWTLPGFRKFSAARTVASWYLPRWGYKMTTALHGGHRAVFPNDALEKVMPLDIIPLYLFKALEVGDIDNAEKLGALELDEEDVALCTLVDLGKNDYTTTLRTMLNTIMKEEE